MSAICKQCNMAHPPETHFQGFHHNWGRKLQITDEVLAELKDRCGPDPPYGCAKSVWALSYREGLSLIEEIERLRALLK